MVDLTSAASVPTNSEVLMIEESLAGTTRHPLNKAVPNGGEEMTGAGVAIAEVGATVFCTLVVIVTLAAMSVSFDGEKVKSALVVGTAITDVGVERENAGLLPTGDIDDGTDAAKLIKANEESKFGAVVVEISDSASLDSAFISQATQFVLSTGLLTQESAAQIAEVD